MKELMDASFVIDHLRGLPEAVARFARMFDEGIEPVVTEVVVCEVRTGLRDEDARWLASFLEPVEFVQPGPDTALLAGVWRAAARRRGFPLSLPDALIAAAAHAVDAAVLTRNTRDLRLTPVRVVTY